MEQNIIARQTAQAKETTTKSAPKSIQDYVKIMMPEIEKALPSVMTPERFTRMVMSAISGNPTLASCSARSFLGAMMTAAQLGLEPNTPLGQAYLIPYKNHGVMEASFQLGYKGLLALAYRSGSIAVIQAQTVYSKDKFEYEYGLEPKLIHVPATGDRGTPVFYYATYKTKDGGYGFQVASIEDIRKHASKYSQAFNKGSTSPWQTNFDEMAKKTVLKQCLKYAPLSSDFARGISADNTVKTDISDDMYTVQSIVINGDTGEVIQDDDVVIAEQQGE